MSDEKVTGVLMCKPRLTRCATRIAVAVFSHGPLLFVVVIAISALLVALFGGDPFGS